jgi:transcription elongation factor Elf1
MVIVPERRVSDVLDRRAIYRGGRRAEDHRTAKPSPDRFCPACQTSMVSTVVYRGAMRTTNYHCSRCGHLEERFSRNE